VNRPSIPLRFQDRLTQDAIVHGVSIVLGLATFESFPMFRQRKRESHRRGKEALLEKHVNEIGSILEACPLDGLRAIGRVFSEQGMDLALFLV
jgi:hypothetical protein